MIWTGFFMIFFPPEISADDHMVGWRMAQIGEFPYVVAIGGSRMCGGTLMTLKSVMTAGHCIYYDTEDERNRALQHIYIIAGVVEIGKRKKLRARQERYPIALKVHEKYERRTLTSKTILFDVGVILLSKPFQNNEIVKPTRIISTRIDEFKRSYQKVVDHREKCLGLEWHWNINTSERKLNVIELIPMSATFCTNFKKSKDLLQTSHGEVCLMPVNHNKSNCYYDTGGPLVCKGLTYGVLSIGFGCSSATSEPVYYFLLWYYMGYYGIGSSLPRLPHSALTWVCATFVLNIHPS